MQAGISPLILAILFTACSLGSRSPMCLCNCGPFYQLPFFLSILVGDCVGSYCRMTLRSRLTSMYLVTTAGKQRVRPLITLTCLERTTLYSRNPRVHRVFVSKRKKPELLFRR